MVELVRSNLGTSFPFYNIFHAVSTCVNGVKVRHAARDPAHGDPALPLPGPGQGPRGRWRLPQRQQGDAAARQVSME